MIEISILLASHQRTTIRYPETPHITWPQTSPFAVSVIMTAPTAANIRKADVNSSFMLNDKLAPFYIALVFIQAMANITETRYPQDPTQNATSTLVLSSPLSFTNAKIPMIVIQIVKIKKAKITLN
jgi:hypothetical protein